MDFVINRICRTCLFEAKQNETLLYIYDTSIDNSEEIIAELLLRSIPHLFIQLEDALPKNICMQCLDALMKVSNFQKMCLKTQRKLLKEVGTRDKVQTANKERDVTKNEVMTSEDPLGFEGKILDDEHFLQKIDCILNDAVTIDEAILRDVSTGTLGENPNIKSEQNDQVAKRTKGDSTKPQIENEAAEGLHVALKDSPLNSTSKSSSPAMFSSNDEFTDESIEKPLHKRIRSKAKRASAQKSKYVKKQYTCKQCNEDFPYSDKLVEHLRIHPGEQLYHCLKCGRGFRDHTNIRRHVTCRHLNKEKKNSHKMKEDPIHKYIHKREDKGPHPCLECGRIFDQLVNLQRHSKQMHKPVKIQKETKPKDHVCEVCGKAFGSSSNLSSHKKRHLEKLQYECSECPKKFACSNDLRKHERYHAKIKNFPCDQCNAAFFSGKDLKIHKMRHNGERNYKCAYCEKRFVCSSTVRKHEHTHTGEKPNKCDYCSRAYVDKIDLMKHQRIHLGENVYKCELCPQRFSTALLRREHFMAHKNDDEVTRLNNLQALQEEEAKLKATLTMTDEDFKKFKFTRKRKSTKKNYK